MTDVMLDKDGYDCHVKLLRRSICQGSLYNRVLIYLKNRDVDGFFQKTYFLNSFEDACQ